MKFTFSLFDYFSMCQRLFPQCNIYTSKVAKVDV